MKCIFCKSFSGDSKSVEHIIPEALGNKKNYLPKGIVCDRCNSYFSIKIEGPLLSSSFFKELRARNSIESKKGRIPVEKMWLQHKSIPAQEIDIEFYRTKHLPILSISQPFASLLVNSDPKDFLIHCQMSDVPPKNDRLMSRLLGKIAIEALAQLLNDQQGDMNILIDDERLNPIREFARFNKFKEE